MLCGLWDDIIMLFCSSSSLKLCWLSEFVLPSLLFLPFFSHSPILSSFDCQWSHTEWRRRERRSNPVASTNLTKRQKLISALELALASAFHPTSVVPSFEELLNGSQETKFELVAPIKKKPQHIPSQTIVIRVYLKLIDSVGKQYFWLINTRWKSKNWCFSERNY